ncbi:MAG: hypothetical protein MJZ88_03085 [Paludibacteraceae bacterium]|nr:hypothetical protein [Paludibacteraceae bacterium]
MDKFYDFNHLLSCFVNLEDPYIGDDLQTNIHIALLKILVFENYVGELLGQDFDGTTMCSAQISTNHVNWATILYDYITSGVSSPSEMALELLESIEFNISTPGMNYDEEMHQMLHNHHLIIGIQNAHYWSLIDGFKYVASSCGMTSDYSHNCIDHIQNHYEYGFATPSKARFYTTY